MGGEIAAEGAPLPSTPDDRWYKVIAPKRQAPLVVTFLSDSFLGFWTHWDGFTLPCTRTMDCRLCQKGNGSRWTGFAAVWYDEEKAEKVLAISEGAARQLLDHRTRRGTLRGCSFEFRRKLPRTNAPVWVRLLKEQDPTKGPPAFDIRDSLNRLWGVNLQRYGMTERRAVSNPVPALDDRRTINPYFRPSADEIPI